MDVEDAGGKRIEQRAFHQPHEPGEAYQIDPGFLEFPRRLHLSRIGKFHPVRSAIDHLRADAVFSRPLQYVGVGIVGKHYGDLCREPAFPDGIQDRLHVRSGT
jgi:hypothetical protein